MAVKIAVAVTGASGSLYAKLLIEKLMNLKEQWQELSLVFSNNAQEVWITEIGDESYRQYSLPFYDKYDFNAPFASGSAAYNIILIVPCSMGVLSRVANGVSDDLITRAADVALKERRKLILMVRETPYNLIHIKNMEKVTLAGGIICPATPSFYSKPNTLEELALTVVDRIIDLAGLKQDTYRWNSEQK